MDNNLPRRSFFKSSLIAGAALTLPNALLAKPTQANQALTHPPLDYAQGKPMIPFSVLAPVDSLPKGQNLNNLWRLPNSSRKLGEFRGKIIARPMEAELIKGVKTQLWCYNDHIPGPLIEVFEGDKVRIDFENHLPQPTTIHWHGMIVPADQDGAPMALVEPGDKRTYSFTIPEDSAGTYWFHPHPHNMTAEQVYRGMAGAVIVRAKKDPLGGLPEQNLIISDLKLDINGQIAPNDMLDWLNGREGQFTLVNGQREPVIELMEAQRWRIWNMNSARYLLLSLQGHPFTLVGTDGGLLEQPQQMKEVLLTPGERVEIVVDPAVLTPLGEVVELSAEPYFRHKMTMVNMHPAPEERKILATVKVSKILRRAYVGPKKMRSIEPLGTPITTRQVVLSKEVNMNEVYEGLKNGRMQGVYFYINGKLYDPNRADFIVKQNSVELWEIFNDSNMDHPFHIHGTQFQVVSRQTAGIEPIPEPFIAWKDTINIKPQEAVFIKVVQTLPGDRMFHCHTLEHEDMGMMATARVI